MRVVAAGGWVESSKSRISTFTFLTKMLEKSKCLRTTFDIFSITTRLGSVPIFSSFGYKEVLRCGLAPLTSGQDKLLKMP